MNGPSPDAPREDSGPVAPAAAAPAGGNRRELSGFMRLLLEAGPLLIFFVANAKWGIFAATAAYMVAAPLAMAISWVLVRRVALMPVIALVFVLAFGGLTIWLHDETFIKVKVTLVNLLFGGILLAGLAFDRPFLKLLLGEGFRMTDVGWRILTRRWGLFFLFLAGLNELIWRNVSTDAWVNFKVFGLLGLTLVFALAQTPLMLRHHTGDGAATE
jgi:intracellular septation protein